MNIMIVGGTFDDAGGRKSSLVEYFYESMCVNNIRDSGVDGTCVGITRENDRVLCANGGYYDTLPTLLNMVTEYDCVIWWANVPNDKPKLRDVKAINPRVMLVTSKRNDGGKYSFQELINRSLSAKANLTVEFSKNESGKFKMMLFDPLGNCWYDGFSVVECCDKLVERVRYLSSITRSASYAAKDHIDDGEVPEVPDKPEFFKLIKEYAEILHELIMPAEGVTRFLGNTSFRCMRGFPSFKDNGLVYVSRRNVDKRHIDRNAFVPTLLIDGDVYYYGDNKPSVDTPIQLRLYELMPNINYMFHSHVYVENAPFTKKMVPCGGLQEVDEVISTILDQYGSLDETFCAVNLIGHGSIIMCSSVDQLKNIHFERRPMPEKHNEE